MRLSRSLRRILSAQIGVGRNVGVHFAHLGTHILRFSVNVVIADLRLILVLHFLHHPLLLFLTNRRSIIDKANNADEQHRGDQKEIGKAFLFHNSNDQRLILMIAQLTQMVPKLGEIL